LPSPADTHGTVDGYGHVFEADVDAVADALEASPRADPRGWRWDEGGTIVVKMTPREAESASHQDVLGVEVGGIEPPSSSDLLGLLRA
jgi:hypothetical protein